jgi:hypothetical protein
MDISTIVEQHNQLWRHANLHLQKLLTHLGTRLSADGWDIVQNVQRDVGQDMADDPTQTGFFLLFGAKGLDGVCLCLSADVKSSYEPVTKSLLHGFGLRVANMAEEVLFEAPLHAWAGKWTASELDTLLGVVTAPDSAAEYYDDIKRRLMH